jgi:TRAP-type C4-dicarboxylate transport system permease small subunit
MRRFLDALYDAAAALAGLCMLALLGMVLLGIAGRALHFHLPGSDAYAGYLMAGAGFLALAHTLKRGEHIRVTLLLGRLQGRARRALELWSLAAASGLAALLAFYSARLVWQSRAFNDISTGSDATPLWLPQLGMALGTLVLLVALVDELLLQWRGQRAHPAGAELLRNE